MREENSWRHSSGTPMEYVGAAGMGILRVTLLFGSAAVALALIVAPLADRHGSSRFSESPTPPQLDYMSTGSISQDRRYTIRRSILQKSPNAVCIIRQDGMRSGDCG